MAGGDSKVAPSEGAPPEKPSFHHETKKDPPADNGKKKKVGILLSVRPRIPRVTVSDAACC